MVPSNKIIINKLLIIMILSIMINYLSIIIRLITLIKLTKKSKNYITLKIITSITIFYKNQSHTHNLQL